MKFRVLFGDEKPVFGMIHLNSDRHNDVMTVARREIELYLANGIYPLIENYFGSSEDCEEVLKWIQETYPGAIYGVNILGDSEDAFRLAAKYGATLRNCFRPSPYISSISGPFSFKRQCISIM